MINFLGIFGKFILKTFVFEHPVDPNSSAFLNEHPVDHCYYPNTTLYQLDLWLSPSLSGNKYKGFYWAEIRGGDKNL